MNEPAVWMNGTPLEDAVVEASKTLTEAMIASELDWELLLGSGEEQGRLVLQLGVPASEMPRILLALRKLVG
jgi:hypothetical protein